MKKTLSKLIFFTLIGLPLSISTMYFADTNKDSVVEVKTEATPKQHAIPDYAKVFSTESSFEDAKDDLLEAIASNGLVVSYTSHAENMLGNTAEVSGVTKAVYQNAEILLFCKADLSHDLVAGNPHNIVLCPYSIAIYVLADQPERVYLSYRTFEFNDEKVKALTKPIEALLVEIIEEVI